MEAKVGVSVLIFNKLGQVLVGKRMGSHGAGLLSVPGGHLDPDETLFNACDRELLEEIGINFNGSYRHAGFSEDIFNSNNTIKHYVTLYFAVDNVDSENLVIKNMEPEKCESWDWINISDLPTVMFCDTFNKILEYHFILK